MRVAGFMMVRNAVKYDYPVLEAIKSVLPICDDFYVLVGNSDDDTLTQIKSLNSVKIKIFESIWNDNLRVGGGVLAAETNKAMDLIPDDYDWLFYMQADEVVHEKYLPTIKQNMELYLHDKKVEGLLFKYLHFIGSFNYIASSRKWYRNEIRIIRNNKQIRSYRDAQGFRKNERKLTVKPIDAYVYHYGYVRSVKAMFYKSLDIYKFYSVNDIEFENFKKKHYETHKDETFNYAHVEMVKNFVGTHPKIMKERIKNNNLNLKLDTSKNNFKNFKDYILYIFEKWFNYRLFEYKNYIKV